MMKAWQRIVIIFICFNSLLRQTGELHYTNSFRCPDYITHLSTWADLPQQFFHLSSGEFCITKTTLTSKAMCSNIVFGNTVVGFMPLISTERSPRGLHTFLPVTVTEPCDGARWNIHTVRLNRGGEYHYFLGKHYFVEEVAYFLKTKFSS